MRAVAPESRATSVRVARSIATRTDGRVVDCMRPLSNDEWSILDRRGRAAHDEVHAEPAEIGAGAAGGRPPHGADAGQLIVVARG